MFLQRLSVVCLGMLMCVPSYADIMEPDAAVAAARAHCGGISEQLNKLKVLAGVGTALGATGTLAGGGALATGIVKVGADADAEQLSMQIADLKRQRDELTDSSNNYSLTSELRAYRKDFIDTYIARVRAEYDVMIQQLQTKYDELEAKSKTLGNVRTGMAAGTTATNIGGAVVASQSKVDEDLEAQVKLCVAAIDNLRESIMQARVTGQDTTKMQEIVDACGGYEYVDVSKINKRASGAQWSSVAGAVVGAGAVATSAAANADSIRDNNMEDGADSKQEKQLNTAANVLSGGAAVASGVATVFSATQIKAITTASETADACEKALQ